MAQELQSRRPEGSRGQEHGCQGLVGAWAWVRRQDFYTTLGGRREREWCICFLLLCNKPPHHSAHKSEIKGGFSGEGLSLCSVQCRLLQVEAEDPFSRWYTHVASKLVLSQSSGPRPQVPSMRPLCRLLELPHCKTAGFQAQTERKVEIPGIS